MDPTEIDTKRIDDLVKEYNKELKIKGSTRIQSLKEEIDQLKLINPANGEYFVQKYSRLFSKPLPVPAAAAPKSRILGALAPPGVWPEHVPKKVTGGKSRRRRNKKGKKKTNKRRRN